MWTQVWPIPELQRLDRESRKIMVENGGKHPLGTRDLLYLPRRAGGKGLLKSIEAEYKLTKVKVAVRLYNNSDPTIELVRQFEEKAQRTGRHYLIGDAQRFAEELAMKLELRCPDPSGTTEQGEVIEGRNIGVWAKKAVQKWRAAPTHTIAGIMELYEQLLPTKLYNSRKSETTDDPEVRCRMCGKAQESVAHVLSGCSALAQTVHDTATDELTDVNIDTSDDQQSVYENLPLDSALPPRKSIDENLTPENIPSTDENLTPENLPSIDENLAPENLPSSDENLTPENLPSTDDPPPTDENLTLVPFRFKLSLVISFLSLANLKAKLTQARILRSVRPFGTFIFAYQEDSGMMSAYTMNTEGILEDVLSAAQDNSPDENSYMVNGESYALRAARTSGQEYRNENQIQRQEHIFNENSMPQRPQTAFFTPDRQTTARSVFDAFANCKVSPTDIQCLQRKLNGEVAVTFKSISAKENFLRLNSLNINSENYALEDIDEPLTFLTIYDTPFELSDFAIIKRLTPYCDVLNYRRGKHTYAPNIYNGLRHYRVRISKPIPSFLRFGKYQIFIQYSGQTPRCRKCNRPGHFNNACLKKICFHCENTGHEARECQRPTLCCICKQEGHIAVNCEYSWVFPTVHGAPTDEKEDVNIDDDNLSSASMENLPLASAFPPPNQSEKPVQPADSDSSSIDENLPLASVLPPPIQFTLPAKQLTDPSSELPATDSTTQPPPEQPNELNQPDLPSEQPDLPSEQPGQSSESTPTDSPLITSQGLIATIKSAIKQPSRRTPAKLPDEFSLACSRKSTAPPLVTGKPRSSIPVPTASHSPEEEMETSHELKRKS
ncbi:Zinc finger CCHC domain-containing protein 3 [Stylophora pistillata]|uniref:Zinc finger CCHC domain-containing protein 3 n=1 Tax=Stylophora pistillata TaxID=50429 RepID=A0A2B4T0C2_STYPI|nr:Zinc finger CCHC domain-containing protein 3 [Stylophora pistillata]